MTEKLLEKSRNIFLSLTPRENLIPKKRVKTSKRNRYQNIRIKNLRTPYTSLNKFFQEKRDISDIHMNSHGFVDQPILKNLQLEKINIIPPMDHNAHDALHSLIGGNINRFSKKIPQVGKNPLLMEFLKKKRKNYQIPPGENPSCLEKNTIQLPFFLKWNQGDLSLANFIKGQLYEDIWNPLFSSYDLKNVYNSGVKRYKAPIRIKNQHKNELIECRKIALFYGNLSKNYLTFLMQRSSGFNLLFMLERRLDVVLKRALFFPTIRGARQWIHQGKILVNHEICIYNSYLLQPGDLISIKEKYKYIWKKEWFKNFKEFDFLRERVENQGENFYPVRDSFIRPRVRFLFPANLMRKWERWCQLWGNTISPGKNTHTWSKQLYTRSLSLHPPFNNSVCADNLYLKSFMQLGNKLHKLRWSCRESTPLISWLKELYRNSFARKNQKHFRYQLISTLLLLQQRGRVIDGLFQQRWNSLLARKKRKQLKKKNCQWGGIKPIHLECSYSCATVIYLFTPQKLVWPSHINVLLLKSALNG